METEEGAAPPRLAGTKRCPHKWIWAVGSVVVVVAAVVAFVVISTSDDDSGGTSFHITGIAPTAGAQSAARLMGKHHGVVPSAVTAANKVFAVMTNSDYGDEWRKLFDIAEDGTFSLDLTAEDPWVLIFIDTSKTGAAMVEGSFRADELDSISPTSSAGSGTDVGSLIYNETGNTLNIQGSIYLEFLEDLGLSEAFADTLGLLDDMMLRYTNPDMDADGNVDMSQAGFPRLDLQFWYHYSYGSDDTDLIDNYVLQGKFLPDNLAMTHGNTAPELRFAQGTDPKFTDLQPRFKLSWTENGDFDGGGSIDSASAGSTPGADTVTFDDANNPGYKVMFEAPYKHIPFGTYQYEIFETVGATVPIVNLTFTNVHTYANATVTEGFVFPWFKVTTNANGDMVTVVVEWRKVSASGKLERTTSEYLQLILGKSSGELKFYSSDNCAMYVNLTPYRDAFAVDKTLVVADDGFWETCWDSKLANQEAVHVSFTTKMGMWMKLVIDKNPP